MWDWEVKTKQPWFRLGIRDLFHYKDLILRFTKRDLLASYQQTLIGPLWVVMQPLLTTLMYVLVFSRVAKISTDDIPPLLFYLPGVILWNYFSECLTGTMNTFQHNAYIFNKVYFPRLAVPISQVLTSTFRMAIQLAIFVVIYVIYIYILHYELTINSSILLLPICLLLCAGFAMGSGLIVSVLTAKYRDLDTLLQFVLRLFMFATPVVYPSSMIAEDYQWLFWLNPLTPAIETLRYAFFGSPAISWETFITSVFSVCILMLVGLVVFKRNEIRVMDTV